MARQKDFQGRKYRQAQKLAEDAFPKALEAFRRGDAAAARAICQTINQRLPGHFGALHLAGILALQSGQAAAAVDLIEKALTVQPRAADAHSNLGYAYRLQNRSGEALTSFRKAIDLQPDFADAHYNAGTLLNQLERGAEALAHFDAALRIKPNHTACLAGKAAALCRLARYAEAVEACDAALAGDASNVEAHNTRGLALAAQGRSEDALRCYDQALALRPQFVEALNNRGSALESLERREEALECHDKAIAVNPGYAQAWYNRGVCLAAMQRFADALASYDRALAIAPALPGALNNRGSALKELGRLEEAIASFDRALDARSDDAVARWNRSLAYLARGDLEAGFREYEWRKRKPDPSTNVEFPQPLWLGEFSLEGKTILVHWEQGLGDTIQFSRYIPMLRDAGARVVFSPQPVLQPLLRTLGPDIEFVDMFRQSVDFDCHAPLLSLPLAFRTRSDTIPAHVPYLHADPALVQRWSQRLGDGFRIGVCWQGGTAGIDVGRSFEAGEFSGLSQLPGVRLISLHKGAGESQLADLPDGMHVETLSADFDAAHGAFMDTAAVMKNCDLVVTSDTAIAHLAGALGVPVWIALKFAPDWRWGMVAEQTRWYPTARLFRQPKPGDWKSVFAAIETALRRQLPAADPQPQPAPPPAPRVVVSWGEIIDKITILEIKSERLHDAPALANVAHELALLNEGAEGALLEHPDLVGIKHALREVNERLWDVEDRLREKEARNEFDAGFIELARSVYINNDRRAALKRRINDLLRSEIIEEKSYKSY